jgi:hypothetical protein
MNKVLNRTINMGLLVGLAAISLAATALPTRVNALDASFVPQATATLTCISEDKTDKKITRFDNNAPAGSRVVLVEGRSEGGGVSFGKEVNLGDVVTNTPQLFWRIDGVQLGPWEVPTTIEGKCLTSEAVYANQPPAPKTNILPYIIGAGSVLVLVGAFVVGKKFGKK